MMKMSHAERIRASILADSTLDRPPVALWRHFPVDDQDPGSLARATIAFQNQYDFDLVKVSPASSFCLRDWGAEDIWEGNTEGTRRYTRRVIQTPLDWENLPILEPVSASALQDQITCLRQLRRSISTDTPLLQTVFNPLSQAKNLVGEDKLLVHLRLYPEAVMKGLQVIALSTSRFIEAAMQAGIDGIFFSVQHAQAGVLSRQEFFDFGLAVDVELLKTSDPLWCNMLHLHGRDLFPDMISSYADHFAIINWHDRETEPSLAGAQCIFKGAVCGGVSQKTIVTSDRRQLMSEVNEAIAMTNGQRIIIGTGCVSPIITPTGNILTIRQSVEKQP
jgi:uroporphyrinogen decarboxylase